jgi:hypothetical protein
MWEGEIIIVPNCSALLHHPVYDQGDKKGKSPKVYID